MQKKYEKFIAEWKFDRSRTIDLLKSLSNQELQWSPGTGVGELWKQFRHLGRVQENYMEALETGAVKFHPDGGYSGAADSGALVQYLQDLDEQLATKLKSLDENVAIDWFGESVPAFEHLLRMLSHETLHHGQFIVYLRLMNKKFPDSWSIWGL